MEKIDVAVQSYKKPESMVYTLLSLKKYCGDLIDTIYINDDCSNDGTVEHYMTKELKNRMKPIKIKTRVNTKNSSYTVTLLTKEMWKKKKLKEKMQLVGHKTIKRLVFHDTSDNVRYQWAINNTDKKYLFLIHDDIKFYDNVLKLYYEIIKENKNMAIIGDLGGCEDCEFGPCGETCSPEKILKGKFPCGSYPITGEKKNLLLKILGRSNRHCRINEWCALVNVNIAKEIFDKYGIYFGNYEKGGDVGTYFFEKIIRLGYDFTDPLPTPQKRKKYYLHWWQGHQGHDIWRQTAEYQREYIIKCLKDEFDYEWK